VTKRRAKLISLFFVPALALLAGCSNRPTESLGAAGLQAKMNPGQMAKIGVVSFKKTDGQAGEVNGVKTYQMDYQAVVKVLESPATYLKPALYLPASGVREAAHYEVMPTEVYFWTPLFGTSKEVALIKKGDLFDAKGTMAFEQSESGWKVYVDSSTVAVTRHQD